MRDLELADRLQNRFGYEWVKQQILKDCRRGLLPKEVARRFGRSEGAVRALARRAGIRFQPVPDFTFLYALLCPRSNEVRYVGKTDNPETRLKAQLASPSNYLLKEWFSELRKDGLRPIFQVLAKVKYQYWSQAEIALIWKYSRTCDLLNIEGIYQIKRKRRTPRDRIMSLSDQAQMESWDGSSQLERSS